MRAANGVLRRELWGQTLSSADTSSSREAVAVPTFPTTIPAARFAIRAASGTDAPAANAIPWLLLDAKSVGPNGRFSKVTSVQRINTVGGQAPATQACDAKSLGARSRVSYTADYVLLTPSLAAY